MEQIEVIGLSEDMDLSNGFFFARFFEFDIKAGELSKITKLFVQVDGEVFHRVNNISVVLGKLSLRIQYLNNEDKLFIQDEEHEFFEEITLKDKGDSVVNLEIMRIYIEKIIDNRVFFSCCIMGEFE